MSAERPYRVLIVEDEELTAQTCADHVTRLPGFTVVGAVGTVDAARRLVAAALDRDGRFPFDVLLLDMNLPDGHGLDLLQQLRAAGFQGGVLALTAATELSVVRRAIALGVVQYLVKPFGFEAFAQRMTGFRSAAALLAGPGRLSGQEHVDDVFRAGQRRGVEELPKGLSAGTLQAVLDLVHDADGGRSASEAAAGLGLSRVTARRYLEHLERIGRVRRRARHGGRGRPEQEYVWAPGAPPA